MFMYCQLNILVFSVNRVAANYVRYKRINIPKGMMIRIPILALHMDPEAWPEPEKFDPERYVLYVYILIVEKYKPLWFVICSICSIKQ